MDGTESYSYIETVFYNNLHPGPIVNTLLPLLAMVMLAILSLIIIRKTLSRLRQMKRPGY